MFSSSAWMQATALSSLIIPRASEKSSSLIFSPPVDSAMNISPKDVTPNSQRRESESMFFVTPPLIPKSIIDLRFASLSFSLNDDLSTVGGIVLGCSMTVVVPPAAAEHDPVYQSSFFTIPGSLKCTCTSIPAGMVNAPFASMRRSGSAEVIFFAIRSIFPLLI
uniref:Uncharacterized protein n=1 Tax=uncultured microorganism TaxID=358574 RepID=I2FJM2_9ZZZZ|nr:hypothetical protein [uncultured microorganism]